MRAVICPSCMRSQKRAMQPSHRRRPQITGCMHAARREHPPVQNGHVNGLNQLSGSISSASDAISSTVRCLSGSYASGSAPTAAHTVAKGWMVSCGWRKTVLCWWGCEPPALRHSAADGSGLCWAVLGCRRQAGTPACCTALHICAEASGRRVASWQHAHCLLD